MSKEKIKVYLYTIVFKLIQIDGYSLEAQKELRKNHSTKFKLIEAKVKKETIEAEKFTGDNIYKILIYFDKLYKVMNDVERRQLITALISEIQIYEEKQPNGQWLKSITFKLPIIDEDLNISLDNDEQVESVALLERR